MFSVLQLIRRLGRQRLLSAGVILGIALAVALGVAVPLATDALAALGLRSTLAALPPPNQHLQFLRENAPFDDEVRQQIDGQLGDLLAERYVVSYLPVLEARRDVDALTRNVRLRTQGGLAEQIDVQRAALPAPALPPSCAATLPEPIEVLISAELLQPGSFAVGNTLCVGDTLPVVIAGSFVAHDPQAPYWFNDLRPLQGEPPAVQLSNELILVLMFDQQDLNSVSSALLGGTGTAHAYRSLARGDAITLGSMASLAARFGTLRAELAALQPHPILVQTGLDGAIATFNARFRLLQSALITLLLLLVVLAMIYVVLIGALVAQQQNTELALLASRGAARRQLLWTQIGQCLVLAVPGTLLGVGLGLLGVVILSRSALFQRLGSGGLELRWTPALLVLPGLILLVAVLGLVVAGRPALSQTQVTLRQAWARPSRPGLARAPVDLVLLLLAGVGVWQLRRQGGSLVVTPDGRAQLNLVALATPTILLIAGSLLFLRLFPAAVRVLGALLARRRGLIAALSAWQLARNPLTYGRLALLLTLTIALGVYSQTVIGTVAGAQQRQALDQAGADVRIPLAPGDDARALAAGLGAAAQTSLSRVDAELLVQRDGVAYRQGSIGLLGVDGIELGDVLQRSGSDDLALLRALRALDTAPITPLGLQLPPGADTLELQAQGDIRQVTLLARLAGANGEREVVLGQPGGEWQTLEAAIPPELEEPLALQSIIVAAGSGPSEGGQRLALDQLVVNAGATRTELDGFEQADGWELLPSTVVMRPRLEAAPGSGGGGAVGLSLGTLDRGSWVALRYRVPAIIPVLGAYGSAGARANLEQPVLLRVGSQQFEAAVQQRLGRFPGADDQQTVLLADQQRLAALLGYGRPGAAGPLELEAVAVPPPPTELRIALAPGAGATPVPNGVTRSAALLAQAADPLSNGLQVILLLGFGCAVLLSIFGLLTYSALTIQARRVEWAVLGALGVSSRQILALIASELGFVLVGSMLAGTALGLLLGAATQPLLAVVVPGGSLTTAGITWQSYLPLVGGLGLALAAALLVLLINVQRRGMIRELRLGEG